VRTALKKKQAEEKIRWCKTLKLAIVSEIMFCLKNVNINASTTLVCGGCSLYWGSVSLMQLCSGRQIFCLLASKQSYYIQFHYKSENLNILLVVI